MNQIEIIPAQVLEQFGWQGARWAPLGNGLINLTYLVEPEAGEPIVLQRLNPIFPARINRDIAALTRHLEQKGLITPHLIQTLDGESWVEHVGACWRALNYIPGVSHDRLKNPNQATEAGALLGRFHRATRDLELEYTNARLGVHDTPRHLRALQEALDRYTEHPRFDTIAALAGKILHLAESLPALPSVEDRVVHGDPKISNFIFAPETDRAICLIDLDTVTQMPLYLELGDAFRSWCNPAGEDTPHGGFSLEMFRAAVEGYGEAAASATTASEWGAVVNATVTIFVELAARFCRDALYEDYFGWDPGRFASHSEHSEVRAAGQLEAARSLIEQRRQADAIISAVFD